MVRSLAAILLCSWFVSPLQAKSSPHAIHYVAVGDVPIHTMQEIEKTVDAHYQRIVDNFKVKRMPDVTIKVWQERDKFELSYGEDAAYVQGYVVQDLWEARFFNGRPEIGLGVVHEYTHLVTLALNQTFNNNPRWLWEATAIYESGRPPVPNISELKCFSKTSYPTIKHLEAHPFNIYKVGYFLTDFIVDTWGQNELVALVKSNGNIVQTLNISVKTFEEEWIAFLQRKHQLIVRDTADEGC